MAPTLHYPGGEAGPSETRLVRAGAGILAVAVAAAYSDSLSGPLVYDDRLWILGNPAIRSLWPLGRVLAAGSGTVLAGRPLLSLSFALDYALGGEAPWSYHATNLAVHVLAALVLFGLVRRTLEGMPGLVAGPLDRGLFSLSVAALWALHPLQTEAVTYVSERAESLAGLAYLLVVYGFARGARSPRPAPWYGLSVGACLLGCATKEVIATAPLVVLAYDRTFVSRGLREALASHRLLYAGLAGSWIALAWLSPGVGHRGIGFGYGYSWWSYALTEGWVVGHYLMLCAWPFPLVFDYGAEPVAYLGDVLPWCALIAALAAVTALGTARRAAWGFLLLAFFALLAPSSSVVPVAFEPMAEHRMYLPLAPVVTLLVWGAWAWRGRRGLHLCLGLGLVSGGVTWLRNADYRSETVLWADTVLRRPDNPRARLALGDALLREGRWAEAAREYGAAERIRPGNTDARLGLSRALTGMGRPDRALEVLRTTASDPGSASRLHDAAGRALESMGRADLAALEYAASLRSEPADAEALSGLARTRRP